MSADAGVCLHKLSGIYAQVWHLLCQNQTREGLYNH